MVDIVDRLTRARMMAGIRSRDTKPELVVRKYLFAAGFRYRLHVRGLPGCPDIVFPKYKAVVLIHGCFWHGHAGCRLFRIPATRPEFWQKKISGNTRRDREALAQLQEKGWRVAIVWECGLRNKSNAVEKLLPALSEFLVGDENYTELGLASD